MARTTRSTMAQEKDKLQDTPPQTRKGQNKKRKRTSNANEAEQPVTKVTRTEDAVKVEDCQEAEELQVEGISEPEPPSSGDVPIHEEDAEKILEVLETIDTQGLLDRIFPLPTEHKVDSTAGPSTGSQSYSFRTLLKPPSKFPLRVLRTAVHHLFPISSHPRSRPSAPAAEQLRFCNLALSLLDQASLHSALVPLDVESLLSTNQTQDATDDAEPKPTATPPRTESPHVERKYALVQRLPTGEYWTSTNSSYPSLALEGKDLTTTGTAYAELVSIFPSAPVSEYKPTLGSYIKKRPPVLGIEQEARRLSCGKFLDYGPFASFAPTFDQDGVEVGQRTLSEVVWYRQLDKRRNRVSALRKQIEGREPAVATEEISEIIEVTNPFSAPLAVAESTDIGPSLDGLLSPEQVAGVKKALGSLELEQVVEELLQRNARALASLERLQAERLLGKDGYKDVEVGSEEWDTAQSILNSLTLLASLRPRTSSDSESVPLKPTTSALRKLHQTLPVDPTTGWYGTLPEGRTTALRDDTTLHVRSGTAVATQAPVAPTPTTPATPVQKPPATPYNYNYPPYAASQYRSNYGPYTAGQTNYYPNYQTGAPTTSHYPNQQYGTSSGAQSYPYSSWYNYQSTNQPSGTQSAQATPTPTSATPSGYASFFANTQQPQPQRAVANTVLQGKAYQAGGWSTGAATPYVAPLPAHLRTAVQPSAPGTPQPTSATSAYSPYYASYQAPQSAR